MSQMILPKTATEFGDDDYMEIHFREGVVYFSIENPWSGDTETGFGRTTSCSFNVEEATTLRDFLDEFIKDNNK